MTDGIYDFAEFIGLDTAEKEHIVDPILPACGLAMVVAGTGVGKTNLCLSLAYAVSVGAPFLRWRIPRARRVLYLDGEMSESDLKSRVRKLAVGYDSRPVSGYFRVGTPARYPGEVVPDLGTISGRSYVESAIDGAELLVLDNLSCMAPSLDENSATDYSHLMQWLIKIKNSGTSVILVHHANKSGDQRGTSKKTDVLNTVIQLRHPWDYRKPQGARFEVHYPKARGFCGDDAEPFVARLVADGESARWEASEIPPPPEKDDSQKNLDRLLKALGG